MRSKLVIDKINDTKMKLGSKVILRKTGKAKVDSEISIKAVKSAKRKRDEEAMDMGQGDDRLPGTDRMLTDITLVPHVLLAGLRSASYKTKRSEGTLTAATLEMETLSQCGESTLQDFKPSSMNQLIPVEYNRMTLSETDEPAGGYMEMVEYRNSARGHLIGLENKNAREGYLETMIQGTAMKQKSYRTLVSSEMHAETMNQLVSLPWRAVELRHFEEEMRTTPKIHVLIAIPYARTELQIRFAWCTTGLTRGEYDSEERKRSKGEKVFLMTSMRDLMTQEDAGVACAKGRGALCFIRFMLEQISVPAFNTCVKMLRESDKRAKALLPTSTFGLQSE